MDDIWTFLLFAVAHTSVALLYSFWVLPRAFKWLFGKMKSNDSDRGH